MNEVTSVGPEEDRGGGTSGEAGGGEVVRQYSEHPLTAAFSAMHNVNHDEQQPQHITLLYDYYRPQGSGPGGPTVGGTMDSKITNGVVEGGLGVAPGEELFLVGGAADAVKREPEDLTRRAPSSASPADRGNLNSDRRRVILPGPPPPSVPSSAGESPPLLEPVVLSLKSGELEHHVIKEEQLDLGSFDRRGPNHAQVIQMPMDSGNSDKMSTGTYIGGFTSVSPGAPTTLYEPVHSYLTSPSPQSYTTSTSPVVRGAPATVYSTGDPFYRDYYTTTEPQYTTVRQDYAPVSDANQTYVLDRYPRPPYKTNGVSGGLTVDLPSPADSGISADAITPRDHPQLLQQSFPYDDMTGQIIGVDQHIRPGSPSRPASRPWHEYTRHPEDRIQIPKLHTDDDKIYIPKIFNQHGYRYTLETPISTSQRREDDRMSYVNKGQFYGITMEYIHDPEKALKPGTVKSVIMLMFREEKTQEDELKAWSFWHSRQHSVKQRILDVDTKNSVGLVGQIQEISHNAVVVYWNPLEQNAKVNVAMQCLSTDFSSQKGVRGLPLHIQIDTYEDSRDVSTLIHRGYCQIKVFCDKGAERKTRDEERRAAKRRMVATTRKKYEDLYHPPTDRSEFYSMADLNKPPSLFTPNEDIDRIPMEIQGLYTHDPENGDLKLPGSPPQQTLDLSSRVNGMDHLTYWKSDIRKDLTPALTNGGIDSPVTDVFSHVAKRSRLTPPLTERLMLYVRQDGENVYTPLHIVPPNTQGLHQAIEQKYNISPVCIYRKNKSGIIAKVDDEMLRHYCNEDVFLMEVQLRDDSYEITLIV